MFVIHDNCIHYGVNYIHHWYTYVLNLDILSPIRHLLPFPFSPSHLNRTYLYAFFCKWRTILHHLWRRLLFSSICYWFLCQKSNEWSYLRFFSLHPWWQTYGTHAAASCSASLKVLKGSSSLLYSIPWVSVSVLF